MLSQFPLTFHQIHSERPRFIAYFYDYSRADWDSLCDYLRDVPWEDIFKLIASAAASEFCEWFRLELMHVSCMTHRKYQVEPHSSPWFSAVCAAAIVHRNHFFSLHQQNKSSES